jgi:hypothetical protein
MSLCLNQSETIDRLPDHIHNPPEAFLSDWHHNGRAHIFGFHPPDQTIGNIHGDAPDHVISQMLSDLDNKVIRLIIDRRVGD